MGSPTRPVVSLEHQCAQAVASGDGSAAQAPKATAHHDETLGIAHVTAARASSNPVPCSSVRLVSPSTRPMLAGAWRASRQQRATSRRGME